MVDEGLLGLQPVTEKWGWTRAHGGVEPERPRHEEKDSAPQLGQWEGAKFQLA